MHRATDRAAIIIARVAVAVVGGGVICAAIIATAATAAVPAATTAAISTSAAIPATAATTAVGTSTTRTRRVLLLLPTRPGKILRKVRSPTLILCKREPKHRTFLCHDIRTMSRRLHPRRHDRGVRAVAKCHILARAGPILDPCLGDTLRGGGSAVTGMRHDSFLGHVGGLFEGRGAEVVGEGESVETLLFALLVDQAEHVVLVEGFSRRDDGKKKSGGAAGEEGETDREKTRHVIM